MTKNELVMLQSLPLDVKIMKTKQRIREFVDRFGNEGVYISFSGGKDSTVLLDIVRSMYPNIEAVFSNTGLEFPEIVKFAMSFDNVTMVRPKRSFKDVIENEGYPIVSKKTSRMIKDLQNPTSKNAKSRKLYTSKYTLDADGNQTDKPNNSFRVADKWMYLVDAPFKVSNKCCDILKKNPLHDYEKEHDKVAIIGTMAGESKQRESAYIQTGCNIFRGNQSKCMPFGFWTEQDILQYIIAFNLPIASVYGDIVEVDGKLTTTGEKRTGCVFCAYGAHLEKGENRYQRLERTHPQLHDYCINKLGFGEVLDYINIPYNADCKKEEISELCEIKKVSGYDQLSFL